MIALCLLAALSIYPEDSKLLEGFTTPEAALLALFKAARDKDFSGAGALCDPARENDGDTDCICALDTTYVPHNCSARKKESYTVETISEYFQTGKISGETVIEEGFAKIPFTFGPDDEQLNETMNLVKRDGFWYLSSF